MLIGIGFVLYDQIFSSTGGEAPPANPVVVGAEDAAPTTAETSGDVVVDEATATPAPTREAAPTLQGAVDIGVSSLLIPRTGAIAQITQVYLDGISWDVSNLGMNIGHLQGTSWVTGTPKGNIVLSGHVELSDGRRGIFAGLDEMRVGETVILTRDGVDHFYRVTELYTVSPDDLTPVYPTTEERLTLITCSGYDFFADTYDERQVVIAERVYDAG